MGRGPSTLVTDLETRVDMGAYGPLLRPIRETPAADLMAIIIFALHSEPLVSLEPDVICPMFLSSLRKTHAESRRNPQKVTSRPTTCQISQFVEII